MNIQETLETLHRASDEVSILEEELNDTVEYELAELIDSDYKISVSVYYTLYSRKFSVELCYMKQNDESKLRDLTIDCDWAKLTISTTTTDAQKIKKLTEFCKTHILGRFDDK